MLVRILLKSITFFFILIVGTLSAQSSDELWTKTSALNKQNVKKRHADNQPKEFLIYNLNLELLYKKLANTSRKIKWINIRILTA